MRVCKLIWWSTGAILYLKAFIVILLLIFQSHSLASIDVVTVHLSSRNIVYGTQALKYIAFCINCPSPDSEGSIAKALVARHCPQDFSVTGELLYVVPNHAESNRPLNRHQFADRIVLVDRGKVSIVEKVQKIIRKSDVKGIIIADDGTCTPDFGFCGARAGSAAEGGFSSYDDPVHWKDVNVPVVIVSVDTANKLRSMMTNKRLPIKKIGMQNVTVLSHHDEL